MAYATYSDIVTRVGRNVGIINDSDYDPKIKDWVNESYQDVWRYFLWPESLLRGTVDSVASQDYIPFPPHVESILSLSQQASPLWLDFHPAAQFVRDFFRSLDSASTGTPRDWTDDGESAVLKDPSAASVVSVSSDSASDVSQTVRVWGRNANDVKLTDSIQLNGTTVVAGTVSMRYVDKISKSATTTGTVTATSNVAAVTLARIAPRDLVSRYLRARLHLSPDAVVTMYWLGKKRIIPLVFDEDTLQIDADEAVIAGACVRSFREQDELEKAELWNGTQSRLLGAMKARIIGQSMRKFQIKPVIPRRYQVRGASGPGGSSLTGEVRG